MAHLRLQLLGEPAVEHAGEVVHFPTRKTLALLAYLAIEPGLHSRETLTALLWPESDTQQGRAALRSTLNSLRHVLDDRSSPHLSIARDALAFDQDGDCALDVALLTEAVRAIPSDSVSVEALVAALAAYRGDFLSGFAVGDAPDFEDWAAQRREQWHQQIQLVCERLTVRQRAIGNLQAAEATLRRWVTLNPLHEPAYQQLMQLYLATGDRDALRRTFALCRSRLIEAFGAEPGPETGRLAASAQAALPPAPEAQPATPGRQETPLVGREQEYLLLVDCFSRLRETGTRVVSVEGEAGAGKTRLASEFLAWAGAHGADVVRGRAFETGGRLPYQPLADAWRARLERENAPDDLLADVWLTELSRLLPELRERYPDLAPPAGDDQAVQSRFYEALARLGLALAARGPLILVLDDLQWVDDASLDVLRYTVRRWSEADAPVLLLLTVRAEALQPRTTIAGWLSTLERDGRLLRLPLDRLTADETATFVQRMVGEDASQTAQATQFAVWLHRESGGLPLFITETLKSLQERGLVLPAHSADGRIVLAIGERLLEQPGAAMLPPGVRDVIRARLFQLDPEAFSMLVAGAILGRLFTFDQLCTVAASDERTGLQALDDLLARHMLQLAHSEGRQLGDPVYLFSHDKIRDVVYTEAGDTRRRLCHRRALALLEQADAPAAELARHALAARQPAAALRYSMAAGDAAMLLFAVRTAVSHYEQAHELARLDPSVAATVLQHLHVRLGRAYELLSEMDRAQTAFEELLVLARATRQPALECVALNRLATLAAQSNFDLDRSRTLLEQARQVAEQGGDRQGLAETEWNLAQLGVYTWAPQVTLAHGQRALKLARELGQDDLIARSLNVLALGYASLGQWWQEERHAAEAARIYAELGNRALEADSLSLQTDALIMSGRTAAGLDLGWRALAITREIDSPWGRVLAVIHLTNGLLDAGAYSEALALTREGTHLARTHQIVPLLPYIQVARGDVERALGLLDEALSSHLEALAADEVMPLRPFAEMIYCALCADYTALGDWQRAHAQARQALAHCRESALFFGLARWHETAALLRGGDEDLARAQTASFAAAVEAAAENKANPRCQIAANRSQAVLAAWTGDRAAAIALLEAAEALATTLELPGEQWQLVAHLATCYEAAGHHEQARAARERATTLANRLAAGIAEPGLRQHFLVATSRTIALREDASTRSH